MKKTAPGKSWDVWLINVITGISLGTNDKKQGRMA